jgi:hypothetical protein
MLRGAQTAAGGIIPPEILVPNLQPDVVISDRNI